MSGGPVLGHFYGAASRMLAAAGWPGDTRVAWWYDDRVVGRVHLSADAPGRTLHVHHDPQLTLEGRNAARAAAGVLRALRAALS